MGGGLVTARATRVKGTTLHNLLPGRIRWCKWLTQFILRSPLL